METLIQNLRNKQTLSEEQLAVGLENHPVGGQPFHHTLFKRHLVDPAILMPALCREWHIPALDSEKISLLIAYPTIQGEPWLSFCLERDILPLAQSEDNLDVAMADPFDFGALSELEQRSRKTVNRYWCSPELIAKEKTKLEELLHKNEEEGESDIDPSQHVRMREDAVSKTKEILDEAIAEGASDIHVEPAEHLVHVRLRVDGLLHEYTSVPQDLYSQLTCRIKIMANLDIAEKRLPQDGAIKYKRWRKEVEFRVSTLPGVYGEKIVLRLLDASNLLLDLEQLGLPPRTLKAYKLLIEKPYGVLLVTGPTASGKTTSLYSTLSLLNEPSTNMITVEDPVEYRIPGMNQIQINTKAGMTFGSALRSILRQDPDIIMVGEMRDQETAEIAIRAALTGHLVFSTLHTNDSPSTFSRLTDMGIAPYLVTSSVLGVLAQRLVRMICPHCKEEHPLSDEEREFLSTKLSAEELAMLNGVPIWKGKGCDKCYHLGYKGRIAVFELIAMDNEVSQAVLRGAEHRQITEAAAAQGYEPLWVDAWQKVRMGLTTIEELKRIGG